MAMRSKLTAASLEILGAMVDNNLLAGKQMTVRELRSATKLPEDIFRAADQYLLEQACVEGTMGGDDGGRWLTALGVDFFEASSDDLTRDTGGLTEAATNSEKGMPDTHAVFVVHGRNEAIRMALFAFLRSLGLRPIEWSQALSRTGKAAPYIGEILDSAFEQAQAIIVLLTPDDEVRLSKALWSDDESDVEKSTRLQARPNVLFEAGMAFGRSPDRTLLVQIGPVKQFSDIAGRHVVRLTNLPDRRIDVANRLRTAGCSVSLEGKDWLHAGDFDLAASGTAPLEEAPAPSVKSVDIKYPEDNGLIADLESDGYEVAWCSEAKLARRLDIDGWSLVTQTTPEGLATSFKLEDRPHDLVLIKKKRR